MEYVDEIKRGAPGSGSVTDPDHMKKVTVEPNTNPTDDKKKDTETS